MLVERVEGSEWDFREVVGERWKIIIGGDGVCQPVGVPVSSMISIIEAEDTPYTWTTKVSIRPS